MKSTQFLVTAAKDTEAKVQLPLYTIPIIFACLTDTHDTQSHLILESCLNRVSAVKMDPRAHTREGVFPHILFIKFVGFFFLGAVSLYRHRQRRGCGRGGQGGLLPGDHARGQAHREFVPDQLRRLRHPGAVGKCTSVLVYVCVFLCLCACVRA